MVGDNRGRRSFLLRRDECGSTLPMIIGFAIVLILLVGVVVDTTAAYLRRQSLDTLADGAALQGADLGASGYQIYAPDASDDQLRVTRGAATKAVHAYLRDVGAYRRYPGLTVVVGVSSKGGRVLVQLSSPLKLPLSVPGIPASLKVGAGGSAEVTFDRE